jgi:hypothetical protein
MNYKLDGHKPVAVHDIREWAMWFETADRRVAEDTIDGQRVSTVFLGVDHNFSGDGPPILFETLVFGGPLDGEGGRCSTWEEAKEQHWAIVSRLREMGVRR